MKFESKITINNKDYNYVDTQRDGISAIYKNDSNYLRIGQKEKIKKDLDFHKKMEEYGFPVPKILEEGIHGDMHYFIEESLGDESFGEIFKKETEQFGKIKDDTFNLFVDILKVFAKAQLKTILPSNSDDSFSKGIKLDILCKELPDKAEEILNTYKKTVQNLKSFPSALLHGDLTPFNIYPNGVIDFEDSFTGPIGYDLGAIIEHVDWFPESKEFELYRFYDFTVEQKKILSEAIDKIYLDHNLPQLSDYLPDFNFSKGVWFAVGMQHTPKLQKYRYNLIDSFLK